MIGAWEKRIVAVLVVLAATTLAGCASDPGTTADSKSTGHKVYKVVGQMLVTPQNGDGLTKVVN